MTGLVDEELIETVRRSLYAAVLSDVLDGLGYRHQVLPPGPAARRQRGAVRPRAHGIVPRCLSRAARPNPYELEIALIDDLRPGDVAVLGCGARTHRPLGRAPDDRQHGARRQRLRHRRPGARRQSHPGAEVPGLSRRHRPARFQGRGEVCAIDVPLECAGDGQSRRSGVWRRRRRGRGAAAGHHADRQECARESRARIVPATS